MHRGCASQTWPGLLLQYTDGHLLLLPVVGHIRVMSQKIGQSNASTYPAEKDRRKRGV